MLRARSVWAWVWTHLARRHTFSPCHKWQLWCCCCCCCYVMTKILFFNDSAWTHFFRNSRSFGLFLCWTPPQMWRPANHDFLTSCIEGVTHGNLCPLVKSFKNSFNNSMCNSMCLPPPHPLKMAATTISTTQVETSSATQRSPLSSSRVEKFPQIPIECILFGPPQRIRRSPNKTLLAVFSPVTTECKIPIKIYERLFSS